MDAEGFAITLKQAEVQEAVRDSTASGIDEIFLIGPIGSTKTFAMAFAHCNIGYQFDDCIIPVGRKDMSEASLTTFPVYLEVLGKMGLVEGEDYTTRQAMNDMRIRFNNTGSIIAFIAMNKSRDREWSKLKLTATCAGVDEIDDVAEDGYDMLYSRTGRRNETGAPRFIISCCNPNDAWMKRNIYLPWLKREGDKRDGISDEEWEEIEPLPANKLVIEFEMEDSPRFKDGYYDRYFDRPLAWQERYLRNNWNYMDDRDSLFKIRTLDTLTISRLKRGQKYIGVDPNAGGGDRAVIALIEDDTLVDMEVYTTEDLMKLAEPDELNPFNPGAVIGRLTIAMAEREHVGYQYIGGDVVGIGQGWLTYMLMKGYKVRQFRAGDTPYQTPTEKEKNIKPPYNMLRSQMFHKYAMATDNAEAFFYVNCPHLSAGKKELLMHNFDNTAKVMAVERKDEIKKRLGASPDIADSIIITWWVRMINIGTTPSGDQRPSLGKSYDEQYNNFR